MTINKPVKKEHEVLIRTSVLVHGIKALLPAMSSDKNRPHIYGMAIEVKGDRFYLVATTGHVIAVIELPLEASTKEGKWILPRPVVEVLHNVAKQIVKVGKTSSSLLWSMAPERFFDDNLGGIDPAFVFDFTDRQCRHAMGTMGLGIVRDKEFPPWEKVIPHWEKLERGGEGVKMSTVTAFSGEYMKSALKSFESVGKIHGGRVLSMVMFAGNPDRDKNVDGDGAEGDQYQPITLRCTTVPELTYVIMPMRISEGEWLRP